MSKNKNAQNESTEQAQSASTESASALAGIVFSGIAALGEAKTFEVNTQIAFYYTESTTRRDIINASSRTGEIHRAIMTVGKREIIAERVSDFVYTIDGNQFDMSTLKSYKTLQSYRENRGYALVLKMLEIAGIKQSTNSAAMTEEDKALLKEADKLAREELKEERKAYNDKKRAARLANVEKLRAAQARAKQSA
jgi:hypothetical protein